MMKGPCKYFISFLDRIVNRLARYYRRGIEIRKDEVIFVEILEHRSMLKLVRTRREPIDLLERILDEERVSRNGTFVAIDSLPGYFVPPPGSTQDLDEWEQSNRPSLLGDIFTCLLDVNDPSRYALWLKSEQLERLATVHTSDTADGGMPCSVLIVSSLKDAPLVPWCALRTTCKSSYLWLMEGGSIHYGCRLRGGFDDIALLGQELDQAINCFQSEKIRWQDASFALLESEDERVVDVLTQRNRSVFDFPWHPRLTNIPEAFRFAALGASMSWDALMWENWNGSGHLNRNNIREAIKILAAIFALSVFVAGFSVGLNVVKCAVDAKCRIKEQRSVGEMKWLKSLDSAQRVGTRIGVRSVSHSISAVANCLPEGMWMASWRSADLPIRHEIELYGPSENDWNQWKTCIESSPYFSSVTARSTEIRNNAYKDSRIHLFVEVRER